MKGVILFFAIAGLALAQTPTGAIEGIVRDQAGAVIAGAQVNVVSTETGLSRSAVSSDAGSYVFAVLSAGGYKVSVTLPGFKDVVRPVTVEAGVTTQADVSLAVGNVTELITVDGAVPQIRYDSHTVGGTITRDQIENLPFNGRNALELAKLNPGVLPPTRASSNRLFVSTL